MSALAVELLRDLDHIGEAVVMAPVVAARMANEHRHPLDFLATVNLAVAGHGTAYNVPLDAPHIRRRHHANRRRNKAARVARRANR